MGFRVVAAATRLLASLCVASTAACALAIGLNDLNEVPCVDGCDGGGDGSSYGEAAAADDGAASDVAARDVAFEGASDGRADADAADSSMGVTDGANESAAPTDAAFDVGADRMEADVVADAEADAKADVEAGDSGPCPCLVGYMAPGGACIGYTPPNGACLPPGLVSLPRTGWTASASTTGGDGSADAANALDGVECSHFSTGVNQAPGQWFELDMGATFSFSVVVLDGDADSADFPGNYALYVSTDGTNWGSAVVNGLGSSSGITTIVFPEQQARYIKIQLTASSSSPWALDEIKVFSAHPPSGTPVPLPQVSWTATASTNVSTASQGIDGNLATRFTTGTNAMSGMWFEVNMGAPVTFDSLTMDTYGNPPGCTDYARAFGVYVSNDGTNWTAVDMATDSQSIVTVTFQKAQTAQYIRVQLTQSLGPWWSIGEFNVYTVSP